MQFKVDNSRMGTIVRDQKLTRKCYVATLKATTPISTYKVEENPRGNKKQAM